MAGRNWRDEERYRDDYWREGARNRPGYEGSDYYGRSGGYQGGDWGSDRGGGPGEYGQDFAHDVRRDSYRDRDYGGFQPNNPVPSNRAYEYDDSSHPAARGYRRDPSRSGEWDRGRDYGRERGGAFWNSDADTDNRRDWEYNPAAGRAVIMGAAMAMRSAASGIAPRTRSPRGSATKTPSGAGARISIAVADRAITSAPAIASGRR